MVGAIATLKIRPESAEKFEGCFAALTKTVRELEPDTQVYQLMRSRNEAGAYRVVEIYASDEAMSQHMKSPHLAEAMKLIRECLAGPPDVQRFDLVGGVSG